MVWVIVVGSLSNGVADVIGPFDSAEDAEAYGDSHNLQHLEWFAIDVTDPHGGLNP